MSDERWLERLIDQAFTEINNNTMRIKELSNLFYADHNMVKVLATLVFLIISCLVTSGLIAHVKNSTPDTVDKSMQHTMLLENELEEQSNMFRGMWFRQIFNTIRNFFLTKREMDTLLKDVVNGQKKIQTIRKELSIEIRKKSEYASTLDSVTKAIGLLTWRKDKDHRYVFASPLHCYGFFGISAMPDCLAFIEGKTDVELITELYTNKGLQNSFGKMCMNSDEFARKNGGVCRFFGAGVVEGEQILLDVYKEPQYGDSGEFIGTIGSARDLSKLSAVFIGILNKWISKGDAKRLYSDDDVFAYVISPGVEDCDIFNHVCPNPGLYDSCNESGCGRCCLNHEECKVGK